MSAVGLIAEITKTQFKAIGLRNVRPDFKAMKSVACISVIGQK